MIRPSSRPRRRIVGAAWFAFSIALALALASSNTIQAQDPAADGSSLARYVPKDNVVFYIEFDGLDAHADAWKKTAAYKILNNTPVGAMLEDVAVQLLERVIPRDAAGNPIRKGADSVLFLKHLARSGFLLAALENKENAKGSGVVFVIRNGFKDKDTRAYLAKMLQDTNAPNTKPQVVVRADHKVISGVDTRGAGFAWWVEDTKKEDLVYVSPSPEVADLVLETLDGKRPSAVDHPRRIELRKPEGRFFANGVAFAEPLMFKEQTFATLGLAGFSKLDFRWGFQDDALMSIARIVTPSPRKGLPALLDGPTFDTGKLPPIPETVTGFTVGSFDTKDTLKKLVDLTKALKPPGESRLKTFLDQIEAYLEAPPKGDLLAHLGPKSAWYVQPNKPGTKAPAAGSNLLGSMMSGAGFDQIPKFAVVFDVDDPTAFGKVLDEAMIVLNRQLRSQGKPPAEAAAKGARGRGAGSGPPSVQFNVMSGSSKMYALNVPSELSNQIPSTFRPAILVGPKHVVVAVSADVARSALESKGKWTAPNELGIAWKGLGSKLKVLAVDDPRDSLPGLLAAFPAKVQGLVNTAMMLATTPPGAGSLPNAGSPPNTDPNAGGNRRSAGPGPIGGSNGTGRPRAPGEPGGPGAPGAPAATGPAPSPSSPLVLQVDAAKLPSPEAIKALLFPSLFSIESDGDEIRISSRVAFPTIGDPSQAVVGLSLVLPAIQAARRGGPPPGMGGPPPGGPPSGGNRGTNPGGSRPGAPGNSSGGGSAPSKPD